MSLPSSSSSPTPNANDLRALWRYPWQLQQGVYRIDDLAPSDQTPRVKPAGGTTPKAPPTRDVAIWGRSNVGKSTLINTLLGRKVARAGGTPGVTQGLMIYEPDAKARKRYAIALRIVDLPGYGFARVSFETRANMDLLTQHYLNHQHTLSELWLLVDGMTGFKPVDTMALDMLLTVGIATRIIITKCDRLSPHARAQQTLAITEALQSHGLVTRGVEVWGAKKHLGLERLRGLLTTVERPHG